MAAVTLSSGRRPMWRKVRDLVPFGIRIIANNDSTKARTAGVISFSIAHQDSATNVSSLKQSV